MSDATHYRHDAKFWAKIVKMDTCWLWTGCLQSGGYGQVRRDGYLWYVHSYVYNLLIGPVPDGLELDHTCRVRNCVNPDHLEPVTHQVNIQRGIGVGQHNANKTHCSQGHPYSGENLYTNPNTGKRYCRTCRRNYV